MVLLKQKSIFSNLTHYFAVIFCLMFLITVFTTFKLLLNDNCNCPKKETIIQYVPSPNYHHNHQKFSQNHKLAVLVPFRERFDELLEFIPHMYNFLNEQKINYDIFVLNQKDNYRFNRGSLINVGYLETKSNYDYIVMHDVDLLPLNKNLYYTYPAMPMHLSAPHLHPRYHYNTFIGGILLINREQFQLVDGFSNNYWGWGLEDDEFYLRLKNANLTVVRPKNILTGTEDTFRHIHGKHRKRDTIKCFNQREVTRKRDRITGLHDVKYNIINYKSMTIGNAPFTVINVELICDHTATPWCDCTTTPSKKST